MEGSGLHHPSVDTKAPLSREALIASIPLFEKFDAQSQKFLLSVKELALMSDEEFIKRHPQLKEQFELFHKKFKLGKDLTPEEREHILAKARKSSEPEEIKDDKWYNIEGSTHWSNYIPNKTIKSLYFGRHNLPTEFTQRVGITEKENWFWFSMWDIVEIKLLEIRDRLRLQAEATSARAENRPMFQRDQYSKRIEKLSWQMVQSWIDKKGYNWVPDDYRPESGSLSSRFLYKLVHEGASMDTGERLQQLQFIFNMAHMLHPNLLPSMVPHVKDLWRFPANILGRVPENMEEWMDALAEFFDELEDLTLSEDDPQGEIRALNQKARAEKIARKKAMAKERARRYEATGAF